MAKLPDILKQTVVAKSRFFTIEELELRFQNGQERRYERLRPGQHRAVLVAAMLDNDTILMIREYGAGVHDYPLGLPKGGVDADEDLLAAANRELQEEAGYAAKQLTHIKTLSISPSYMSHKIELILAEDLYPQRLQGDEPEPIEVIPFPLSRLDEWVWENDLTEARTVAALFLIRQFLANRKIQA